MNVSRKKANPNVNQKQSKYYRSFVTAVLLANSLFQFVAPVLAEGTKAGESISNTATATYEDPLDPGTKINTTSNTVVVTVAEVAGITVTASGITDSTPATPVSVGDTVNYTYTITNVGNDPTKFRIPNLAKVTGPGVAGTLEVSTDGGTTFTPISGSELITGSIPAGGSVQVRVPVTVQAGAQANDIINVTLGDTPGDAQNQARDPNGGDVYTVDNPDAPPVTNEVPGTPVNGTREASVTQKSTVNQSVKTYALATILKTRSDYNNAGTPAIDDDKLTYSLGLRVELNDPTGNGITPAPLAGTLVKGLGVRILVSDAIPVGTELAVAPTPPPGWQAVYTIDAVASKNANAATWSLTPPPTLSTVTRIGFVNDPSVVTSVSPGQTVNGFNVQVKVKAGTVSALTVNNIAQLFGQTSGVPPVDTNSDGVADNPVYDESGDQNPSNYDGRTIPLGSTDPDGDGIPNTPSTIPDGLIDTELGTTGTDPGNNNSGTGPGGEANSFDITIPVASAVLNGPDRAPDAIGLTSNNDDFTNKSSFVPSDKKPGDTIDPSPVAFTNTVKNSGTDPGTITLAPTLPLSINKLDLPNSTQVTITYASSSAVYTYDQAAGTFTLASGGTPITIPNVAPGATVNYGVEVNLPTGTPLSTDIIPKYTGDTEFGFPIPITASSVNAGGTISTNTTIDRVYTGFLKLLKESRVLPGTGPAVQGSDGTFSVDPKKPAPGNIIEYQISYSNISQAQSGTGNVTLKADKVVIVEDGTLSTDTINTPIAQRDGKNNWAKDNDVSGQIDTSNIVGTAQDTGASTIQFYSGATGTNSSIDQTGTTADTDVSKYVNTVTGTVAPGETRKFVFQRKVN